MRNQFDRQLNTLNGELIQMGHMVEQAICCGKNSRRRLFRKGGKTDRPSFYP